MGTKVVLLAFRDEPMCFAHVLLHALDLNEKGYDVRVVIEGAATRRIRDLADPNQPFAGLYARVRQAGLIDAVCKACAAQMDALEAAREQGLPIADAVHGHPSLSAYLEEEYDIIPF